MENEHEGWGRSSRRKDAIWHYFAAKKAEGLCGKGYRGACNRLTSDESGLIACQECKRLLLRFGEVLTEKEAAILNAWANGLGREDSYTRIGLALDLHPNTIRYHRDSIYKKLGAVSPAHAVYLAMKGGLLE